MTTAQPPQPWLVTGAAGFLGSHVVEKLLDEGESVVALDNLLWGDLNHLRPCFGRPGFNLALADIRDSKAVAGVVDQFRPGAIVHLAALHYIPAAVADPALAVGINVLGTQVMLAAAAKAEVARFWFASTGDVYPPSDSPHVETDAPSPFNIYGLSKHQGEQLIALASRDRPTAHFLIGRLFNLYGARETNPHILPEILKQLRAKPDAALRLGNIWPKRDLVPVTEAARAVIETVRKAPEGVTTVNVATGTARSVEEVIRMIGDLRGTPVKVETDPAKVRPVERNHLQADVTKLRALIGWAPHDDLDRGLTELLRGEGMLG